MIEKRKRVEEGWNNWNANNICDFYITLFVGYKTHIFSNNQLLHKRKVQNFIDISWKGKSMSKNKTSEIAYDRSFTLNISYVNHNLKRYLHKIFKVIVAERLWWFSKRQERLRLCCLRLLTNFISLQNSSVLLSYVCIPAGSCKTKSKASFGVMSQWTLGSLDVLVIFRQHLTFTSSPSVKTLPSIKILGKSVEKEEHECHYGW